MFWEVTLLQTEEEDTFSSWPALEEGVQVTLNIPRRHSHMVHSRKPMEQTQRWSGPHTGRGAGGAGRQSWGRQAGVWGGLGVALTVRAPRETELRRQCGSQTEKQKREREGVGVPGLGERGMDGWRKRDGGHREEGRDQQKERRKERKTEEERTVSSVCVHVNIWPTQLSFSFANHHGVRDR